MSPRRSLLRGLHRLEWARSLPGAGAAVREALRGLEDLGEAHAVAENNIRDLESQLERAKRIHEQAEDDLKAAEDQLEAQLRAHWSEAEIKAARKAKR